MEGVRVEEGGLPREAIVAWRRAEGRSLKDADKTPHSHLAGILFFLPLRLHIAVNSSLDLQRYNDTRLLLSFRSSLFQPGFTVVSSLGTGATKKACQSNVFSLYISPWQFHLNMRFSPSLPCFLSLNSEFL